MNSTFAPSGIGWGIPSCEIPAHDLAVNISTNQNQAGEHPAYGATNNERLNFPQLVVFQWQYRFIQYLDYRLLISQRNLRDFLVFNQFRQYRSIGLYVNSAPLRSHTEAL